MVGFVIRVADSVASTLIHTLASIVASLITCFAEF